MTFQEYNPQKSYYFIANLLTYKKNGLTTMASPFFLQVPSLGDLGVFNLLEGYP